MSGMTKRCALLLLLLSLAASIALPQKVSQILPSGTRVPMRSGTLDCAGFLDYNSHALHAACSDLPSSRMLATADLTMPNTVNDSMVVRMQHTGDWVEWSLIREVGTNRWRVTDSAGQSATGTF